MKERCGISFIVFQSGIINSFTLSIALLLPNSFSNRYIILHYKKNVHNVLFPIFVG